MKTAISPIVNLAADSGSADLKRTDGATCKEAQVEVMLVTPNRAPDWLSIQSLRRLRA
jgi:hypothetical protein